MSSSESSPAASSGTNDDLAPDASAPDSAASGADASENAPREGGASDRETSPFGPSWLDGSTRRMVGWVLLEIVIVFVGVYGAFWLERQRQAQQAERRAVQAYESLHHLLTTEIASDLRRSATFFDSMYVDGFLEPYRAGERPLPVPVQWQQGGFKTQTWEAILQSGGVDGLSIEFMLDVETYFTTLDVLLMRIGSVDALSTEQILPALDGGTTAFYRPDSDKLRSQYRWYPGKIESVSSSLHYAVEYTDSLIVRLDAQLAEP